MAVKESCVGDRNGQDGQERLKMNLFDQFWSAYPRKTAKGRAKKIWSRLGITEDLLTQILLAISQAKRTPQWEKDGGEYIPYPATWLNDEGWLDEYPETIINERGIRVTNPILRNVANK